jgi:hypothetical protein
MAGGGNYQTLINDALLEHIHRGSTLDAARQVLGHRALRAAFTPPAWTFSPRFGEHWRYDLATRPRRGLSERMT